MEHLKLSKLRRDERSLLFCGHTTRRIGDVPQGTSLTDLQHLQNLFIPENSKTLFIATKTHSKYMVLAQLSDEKSDRGKIKKLSHLLKTYGLFFSYSSFIPKHKKNLKAMMDIQINIFK